jgi:hypothetical protein
MIFGPISGRWFSLGTPVSSTNKTNHHDITEILLKVLLKDKVLLTVGCTIFPEMGIFH